MISYVIPVLNEEKSLPSLYQEIIKNNPDSKYELLFIDDGSSDRSFDVLTQLADIDPRVKIIKFRTNFGKATALDVGFKVAQGDLVFTLDSDLQDDPAEISRFISKINEGFDLVSGWKKKRIDPLFKTIPSKIFNYITKLTFNIQLNDFNCGYKLYRRKVVKELVIYGEMHRYIPVLASSLGFKVSEIEVNHRKREFGSSKYGFERYMRGFFDLLTVKMVTKYSKSPLYLFGGVGIVLFMFGSLLTIYLSILKIFFNIPLTNRPLLFLGILLILAGLQFFSMGLICELIINKSQSSKSRISIESSRNLSQEIINQLID